MKHIFILNPIAGSGFAKSLERDIIDLAVEHEILGKSGAFYKYNDQNIGQGRENAKRYLLENLDVMSEIDAKVRAKIRGEEFVKETPNEEKTEE